MSDKSDNRAPSFVLTKLYRKKSEKSGATYFKGRLGGARVVLVKSNFTADDGAEIWNLLASEAPQKQDSGTGQRAQEQQNGGRQSQPAGSAARGWQKPLEDEINFAAEVR